MFHCAAMCGPLKLSLVKNGVGSFLYHSGRLIAYLSLAIMMHYGALSSTMSFQKENSWWIFLLLSLIVFVVIYFLAKKYYLKMNAYIGNRFVNTIQKLESTNLKSFSVGLLTGILPCGVLYAFLLSIAMVERLEVIIASVMVFTAITGFGVSASGFILKSLSSKIKIDKRKFTIVMVIISYAFIVNRFVGDQLIGMCFS